MEILQQRQQTSTVPKLVKFTRLVDKKTVEKTIESLRSNGIEAIFVKSSNEAKKKVLELIPEGAEIAPATSTTIDSISLTEALESKRFNNLKVKVRQENDKIKRDQLRRDSTSAEFTIGSVHAVTENGRLMIASGSGSQLPQYAYSSKRVILVVGTHKIVKNLEEGFDRVYNHSLPLENVRALKEYGVESAVRKLLIINAESVPGRITVIFIPEVLGF